MTDTVKSWIRERRAARVPNSTLSVSDAHNNLPRALTALDSVLELHKPIFYYEHEDSCTNTDEDHRAELHVEFDLGEYYCEDLPTGEKTCESCYDDEGERVMYPCPTVQAVQTAIEGGR